MEIIKIFRSKRENFKKRLLKSLKTISVDMESRRSAHKNLFI